MQKYLLPAFVALTLCLVSAPAEAAFVTYDFTATVTTAADVGLLDTDLNYGDEIAGSFTIDDAAADYSWSSSTGRYPTALVDWSYQLDHDLISGTGGNVTVTNASTDSVEVGANSFNGSMDIDGNDIALFTTSIAVLEDTDGSVLDSDALPDFASLSLDDFEVASLGAFALDIDGVTLFAGDITSITPAGSTVTSVPELDPASLGSAGALLLSSATVLRSRRRRS